MAKRTTGDQLSVVPISICRALAGIQAQVRENRRVDMLLAADPAEGLFDEAILEVVSERWVTMCVRVGLSQRKNGSPSLLALSTNSSDRSRISSSTVFDLLLAGLAPTRQFGRIVFTGIVRRHRLDELGRLLAQIAFVKRAHPGRPGGHALQMRWRAALASRPP